jgi:cardiolipin synthase
VIIERLVRAAARGVKMHILARPAHFLKKGKLVEGVEGCASSRISAPRCTAQGPQAARQDDARRWRARSSGRSTSLPAAFDSRRELAIEVTTKR